MKLLLSFLSLFVLVHSFQYVPVFTGEQRLNLYTMEDKGRFKRLADLALATCSVNLVSSTERAALTTQTAGVLGLFSFSFQMIKNNSLALMSSVRPIKAQIWSTLVDIKIARVAELSASFAEVMAESNENARETLGLNYCRDLKRFVAEVLIFYDECETNMIENLYPYYTDQQLYQKSVEIIQLTTGYLQLKNAMATSSSINLTPKELARFFQYAIGAYTPAQAQEIRDALQPPAMTTERYATFNSLAPQVPP
jgi:hypothetical protein